MPPFVRTVVGVVVGTVVAFVLVGVIEAVGEFVYPPPAGVDPGRSDQLASYIQRLPGGAHWRSCSPRGSWRRSSVAWSPRGSRARAARSPRRSSARWCSPRRSRTSR
jgi:hypothetical protein